MIPEGLTNEDDDWQEKLRSFLYPKLHGYLRSLSDVIGVPLFAVKETSEARHVGTVGVSAEELEVQLANAGARRNPIAAYKTLPDGRASIGSWVIIYQSHPDLVEPGMQLHFTLFESDGGRVGVHAHYEDDWRSSAIKHLRGTNFDVDSGKEKAKKFFNSQMDADLQ